MSNRLLLFIALFLLNAATLMAQPSGTGIANRMGENINRGPSLDKIEEKADEAFEEEDYYQAMDYYNRVITADSSRIHSIKGFAKASFAHSAYFQAKWANTRILQLEPDNADAQLALAEIYYREGRYSDAREIYSEYLLNPNNKPSDKLQLATKGIQSTDWALIEKDRSEYSSEAILLDTSENSVNTTHSEYMNWPRMDGTFLFSSYRFEQKDRSNRYRDRFQVKVMEAEPRTDAPSLYKATSEDFNDTKKHTMHPTISRSGDLMIYALGEFINSADIRSHLYMRRKQPNGQWGAAEKLPPSINMEGYTATEPNLGMAPGQSEEVLYFVSDRPGGKGGRDIWYVLLMPNGAMTEPANLTQLNTTVDDVTPFYHSKTGRLYYSTMGQQTLGGFDVYESVGNGLNWGAPKHLSSPVNSSANDVFFTLTDDAKTAYLSSNRLGSYNISEEACCYDIFQVPLVLPQMVAVTFNALTRDSLARTNIRLYELVDGRPVLRDSAMTIGVPYHPFSVKPGKTYIVIADRPGYGSDTTELIPPRTVWPGVISSNLYLTPMKVDLVAKVYDKKTKEPIPGATARFVDLGPVGRTIPKGGGGEVGTVSTNTAGNDYYYNLEYDHKYMVYVSKNGYTVDSTIVSTEGMRTTQTLYRDLYINKGLALEALVFDNTSIENPVPISGVTFDLSLAPQKEDPSLIETQLRPVDNQYKNLISYGLRYRIIVSKEGYSSDTVFFNAPAMSIKAFDVVKQELNIHSLKLPDYLPIRLYFDNDRPDRRSQSTTTTTLYSQTYFAYYPKKDTFVYEYTKILGGGDRELGRLELEQFFEDSVKGEWNRLRTFTEVLFEKLSRGEHVEITLKGFASKRAATDYNKKLTARRIMSVKNHFAEFDGALLDKFVQSGQLVITEEPNGENSSRETIKEPLTSETRNSVFSPAASKERRVEIIGIEFKGKKE
jgi:tetratricopeptide (TPR) repeat protein